jgi:NAD(P)-dependent dehydrogenase (short-subunit alcohol dehydrogenase family)
LAERIGSSRRIFITGGASGLGKSLAERYAGEGWRVCIGDIQDARGQECVAALRARAPEAHFLRCDVTREEDLESAVQWLQTHWGGVDVVVNNAGVAQAGKVADVPLEDWRWILEINLLGVVRGCKVFTPLFQRQGHGHFVNIASMAGLVHPPTMAAYNASKAAVVALSETLLLELAGDNIAVTVACPSFFRTNLADSLRASDARLLKLTEKLVTKSRFTSAEIARQVYAGVAKKRVFVLTHTDGRVAWMMKRLAPYALYSAAMARMTRGLVQR